MKKVKEKIIEATLENEIKEPSGNGNKPVDMEEPNGHKPEEAIIVAQPKPASTEVIQYEVNEGSKEIPGSGFFFNVLPKYLPESSRVTELEAKAFAIGDVQQEIINPYRKQRAYEIFRDRILRYKISIGGDGRAEFSTLVQLKQDEANRRKGDLFDKM